MAKVSVIVPAFNASSTICRMMDSLLCQTLKDIEILVIDDGSTDDTGTILDYYAANDDRVRVFHKKNEGVAMARQLGIDNAKGEYSIHADADDWVEPKMLENMYDMAKAEDADVVIADFYRVSISDAKSLENCHLEPDEKYSAQKPASFKPHDILDDILNGRLFGALWNKMIRLSLYKEYDAKFYKGINYCEDVLILLQLLRNTNIKISRMDQAYYHYAVNPDSITHGGSMASYNSTLLFAERAVTFMPDTPQFAHHKRRLPFYYFMLAFNAGAIQAENLQREFRKVRNYAYDTSPLKWRLGFVCIDLRLYTLAHLLLRF